MTRAKRALRFTLAMLPAALLAGYFGGKYSLASVPAEALEQAARQVGGPAAVLWITAAQMALYAAASAFFGYLLADRLGLMRPLRIDRKPLLRALAVAAVCGVALSLDAWTFGRWIPEVGASYADAGRFDAVTWLASIFYGGIVEELMMRLLIMSLLALIGWKLFHRAQEKPPTAALVGANVIAAALFAAGHLPATAMLFGRLTPMILLRCFLMNGAFGLLFGRLYRKYGIQYAMIAHALTHVVSRTIWILFL